jgi:hypothetical protein
MTALGGQGRISHQVRLERVAVGMRVGHPELVSSTPGRADWKLLFAWCAELWLRGEYTAIVAEAWRRDGS